MNSHHEELKTLELLSIQISDLIHQNNFEKIVELDLERKTIINKISNRDNSFYKNKISQVMNMNKISISSIEVKIKNLIKKNNKFIKRTKFYSITK